MDALRYVERYAYQFQMDGACFCDYGCCNHRIRNYPDRGPNTALIDNNSGGWGHPNFDDVHQADSKGENIPWDRVLAVDARGKLAVSWAQMKKYY